MNLFLTVRDIKTRLVVHFINEKHVGQKHPERDFTINFQKYKLNVDIGDPLPDDSEKSKFFEMIEFIDEFFYKEMQTRIDEKRIGVRSNRRRKKDSLPRDAITVENIRIIPLMRTHVSKESKTNPEAELSNPIVRSAVKINKKLKLYDHTKEYSRKVNTGNGKEERTYYKHLTCNGEKVTEFNIHEVVKSKSLLKGIIRMHAVCALNMGLSIPRNAEVLVVKPPALEEGFHKLDINDVFDEEYKKLETIMPIPKEVLEEMEDMIPNAEKIYNSSDFLKPLEQKPENPK